MFILYYNIRNFDNKGFVAVFIILRWEIVFDNVSYISINININESVEPIICNVNLTLFNVSFCEDAIVFSLFKPLIKLLYLLCECTVYIQSNIAYITNNQLLAQNAKIKLTTLNVNSIL